MKSIALIAVALAALVAAEEVTSIPGFSGELPSKTYSGYLNPSGEADGQHLFYIYTECTENPEKAPVLLWLNGGPGCSSLDGFFYEHGALLFKEDYSDPDDMLQVNPYSWNTVSY